MVTESVHRKKVKLHEVSKFEHHAEYAVIHDSWTLLLINTIITGGSQAGHPELRLLCKIDEANELKNFKKVS